MQLVLKMLAQGGRRNLIVLVLRLKQHDGPYIAVAGGFILQRLAFQRALALHGGKHGLLPALGVLGQCNGQLDHAFRGQFLRADVMQHIGFAGCTC